MMVLKLWDQSTNLFGGRMKFSEHVLGAIRIGLSKGLYNNKGEQKRNQCTKEDDENNDESQVMRIATKSIRLDVMISYARYLT